MTGIRVLQFGQQQQSQGEPADPDAAIDAETILHRKWCVAQASAVAMNLAAHAPNQPFLDIMATAEEMYEFLETGVSRRTKAQTKQ